MVRNANNEDLQRPNVEDEAVLLMLEVREWVSEVVCGGGGFGVIW